ncbi:class I SAM-dependent methyltransferase, partial [bacterium]
EPNPEWAECARPYYRDLQLSTIEDATLPDNTYRLVVCADVLEHVPDPAGAIEVLKKATTDDAIFLISLPNVAHLAVRLMLLFGRFPHMDRGILDRTHLHFYTLDTARDMLEGAGLKVVRATPTGIPVDELFPNLKGKPIFQVLMKSQHAMLRIAPRLFGFQWVFILKKA